MIILDETQRDLIIPSIIGNLEGYQQGYEDGFNAGYNRAKEENDGNN